MVFDFFLGGTEYVVSGGMMDGKVFFLIAIALVSFKSHVSLGGIDDYGEVDAYFRRIQREADVEDAKTLTPQERYQERLIVFTRGEPADFDSEGYLELGALTGQKTVFRQSGGFVGGGGGSGVLRGEDFDFLDLVQFDGNFHDVKQSHGRHSLNIDLVSKTEGSKGSARKTLKLPLYDNSGLSKKTLSVQVESDVGGRGRELQRLFKKSDPFVHAEKVLNSFSIALAVPSLLLGNISWHFTSEEPRNGRRFNPKGLKVDALETVGYLHSVPVNGKKRTFVVISVPRWNRLGFFGQVGMIVHEALRVYQLSSSHPDQKHHFSEDSLQRATSLATLCHPNSEGLRYYLLALLSTYNGYHGGVDGLGVGVTHGKVRESCQRVDREN